MIVAKIDVSKINKEYLYQGKTTKYLDIALVPNKNGRNTYGNDGMVTQSIPKAAREAGKRGPIIGNYNDLDYKEPTHNQPKPVSENDPLGPEDDVPF